MMAFSHLFLLYNQVIAVFISRISRKHPGGHLRSNVWFPLTKYLSPTHPGNVSSSITGVVFDAWCTSAVHTAVTCTLAFSQPLAVIPFLLPQLRKDSKPLFLGKKHVSAPPPMWLKLNMSPLPQTWKAFPQYGPITATAT
jgi:hypothetical protein